MADTVNRKYKNITTGEITTSYKEGKEFLIDGFQGNPDLDCKEEMKGFSKKDIILEGNSLLEDDPDWKEIK